jgi:hypothetical protein
VAVAVERHNRTLIGTTEGNTWGLRSTPSRGRGNKSQRRTVKEIELIIRVIIIKGCNGSSRFEWYMTSSTLRVVLEYRNKRLVADGA